MKKVFLSFVFTLLNIVAFAQGTWQVDQMHSSVNFNIKHMGISFVQGRFDKFDGKAATGGANLDNADLNFSIPQFNLFGSTADLKEQLDFIRLKLPQSDLYAVGSSAGSGLLVRYLGEVADQSCFKAAFAFCPGYNIETGFDKVHPVYSRYMAKKIINRFVKKHLQGWSHIDNLKELLTSKNLTEFHVRYYQLAGFSNYQDYTLATNPMHVFKQIKVPLMVLNSQDDPVCHIDNFAPYLPEIQAMQNIAVVTTKKGSHCAFYEGWRTQSWATKLMADFFLSQK